MGGHRDAPPRALSLPPIVEARGLRKSYQRGSVRVPALRGVDLAVARGEMVAIMGPSGCGKTTLLNCLAGLDRIDAGDVLVEGRSLSRMSDDARANYRARRMGFVFQAYNLLPVLTALENVELPLLLAGASERETRERSRALLAEVGLGAHLAHRPAQLSGGQQQRVAIARALVPEPAIVWADEPTGNLDSEAAAEILDLMARLNRTLGQTLVIVTHAPEVARRAHRLITMRDGRIESDEPSAVSHQPSAVGDLSSGGDWLAARRAGEAAPWPGFERAAPADRAPGHHRWPTTDG